MAAVGNYEVVTGSATLSAFQKKVVTAPVGKRVLSGSITSPDRYDVFGYPSVDGTGWTWECRSNSAGTFSYAVICAEMG